MTIKGSTNNQVSTLFHSQATQSIGEPGLRMAFLYFILWFLSDCHRLAPPFLSQPPREEGRCGFLPLQGPSSPIEADPASAAAAHFPLGTPGQAWSQALLLQPSSQVPLIDHLEFSPEVAFSTLQRAAALH